MVLVQRGDYTNGGRTSRDGSAIRADDLKRICHKRQWRIAESTDERFVDLRPSRSSAKTGCEKAHRLLGGPAGKGPPPGGSECWGFRALVFRRAGRTRSRWAARHRLLMVCRWGWGGPTKRLLAAPTVLDSALSGWNLFQALSRIAPLLPKS